MPLRDAEYYGGTLDPSATPRRRESLAREQAFFSLLEAKQPEHLSGPVRRVSWETEFYLNQYRLDAAPCLRNAQAHGWDRLCHHTLSRQCTSSNDLLAGAVDAIIDNNTSIVPHARAGSVWGSWYLDPHALAAGTGFRVADTVPGFAALAFSGVAVRTGPPEICDSIEAAVKAVCKDPVLIERMTPLLAEVVGSGVKEFGEFIAAERTKWGKLTIDLKSGSVTSPELAPNWPRTGPALWRGAPMPQCGFQAGKRTPSGRGRRMRALSAGPRSRSD